MREGTPQSHKALPLVFGGARVRSMPLQPPVPSWSWPPSGDRDEPTQGPERAWQSIRRALPPAKVEVLIWLLPPLHLSLLKGPCRCPTGAQETLQADCLVPATAPSVTPVVAISFTAS